ncbi:6-phosphogluconolactonase [Litorimonas taeanensis]|uniref:6-phosphogluconolactonase n=1 Tax=Litorimonas taeanensis TaxID=568099 RepID=A0A420WLF2_9PROT|nr:6-phosphogluconolactonase [Litorimonas taeanensis]RKQ71858.1 6-phosphogluconolactonase [Litorimonas taeanensis]
MSDLDYGYRILDDAGQYVEHASAYIEKALRGALTERGKASLLVSGGSSPKPVYEMLSHVDLPWENVTISLVDERWVKEGEAGSNADFIKATLLQNRASSAMFFPLTNEKTTAKLGAKELTKTFDETFPDPIDVCVMGMGKDGHTASWFPHASTLAQAFEIDGADSLVWQDATGQAGNSGFCDRITVSLPLVMRARHVPLLIPGHQKKTVWDVSGEKDVFEAPVTTLRAAGPRLTVFTHLGE